MRVRGHSMHASPRPWLASGSWNFDWCRWVHPRSPYPTVGCHNFCCTSNPNRFRSSLTAVACSDTMATCSKACALEAYSKLSLWVPRTDSSLNSMSVDWQRNSILDVDAAYRRRDSALFAIHCRMHRWCSHSSRMHDGTLSTICLHCVMLAIFDAKPAAHAPGANYPKRFVPVSRRRTWIYVDSMWIRQGAWNYPWIDG